MTKADDIKRLGLEAGEENKREKRIDFTGGRVEEPAPHHVTRTLDRRSAYPYAILEKMMTSFIDRLMPIVHPDMHIMNPHGRQDCLEKLLSIAFSGGETGYHRSMNDYVSAKEHEHAQGSTNPSGQGSSPTSA